MHESLGKAGEKLPYILVGHSMGSLEAIRFAQMYKDEVKGIVMIEAGNPEYYANENIDQDSKWKKSQESFKAWSKDSKQRIVKDSPHYIHQYKPNEVNSEIIDIINNLDSTSTN